MKKHRIVMGALALAMAAVAIIACSKEKTAQQETPAEQQQTANPNDLTLADMAEALSWEEGKAFFENQPIKDYTYVCEKLFNDCGFAEKEAGIPYEIVWRWRMPNGDCDPEVSGTCLMVRKKENDSSQANAMGYYEDGKLVIVPTTEENGFTADGYLAMGVPIEVQYENIVVQEGIYVAYYDVEAGRYTAVAVDYYRTN
ncbi:MAG: hypothetical protein IKI09_08935 [Bacteroidales bacterium]|nr:hypothetical protein [Bacteroidales bacterium]